MTNTWITLHENADWITYALQLSDSHWLWLRYDKSYNASNDDYKNNYIVQIMQYTFDTQYTDNNQPYQGLSTTLLFKESLFALELNTAQQFAINIKNKWLEAQKQEAIQTYETKIRELNLMLGYYDLPNVDLNANINTLNGLPLRTQRALHANNYTTIKDLVSVTEKTIQQIPGIGQSSIFRTKQALKKLGLSFKPERIDL